MRLFRRAFPTDIRTFQKELSETLFYIQKAIEMVEHTENGKIQSKIYQNAHVYCRKNRIFYHNLL